MTSIQEATAIILTEAERAELEALARSTKTQYRLRQRARIVLLAAGGMATRAIGREAGCTTGTASKWRVRYAEKRLAGLDETGERGNDPKYTSETDKRILCVLDSPAPGGYARWTGPLIANAFGDVDVQYVWRFLRAQKIDLSARKSWCESNDPDFAAKAAENRWGLSQSAGKRVGSGRGREAIDPGPGAPPRLSQTGQWACVDGPKPPV